MTDKSYRIHIVTVIGNRGYLKALDDFRRLQASICVSKRANVPAAALKCPCGYIQMSSSGGGIFDALLGSVLFRCYAIYEVKIKPWDSTLAKTLPRHRSQWPTFARKIRILRLENHMPKVGKNVFCGLRVSCGSWLLCPLLSYYRRA